MPIYEYRCDACGAKTEALQKISDAPLVDCPACQQPALRKLVSAAAFRLKGGGWYETDFKKSDRQRNVAGDKDQGASKTDAAESSKASGPTDKTGSKADKPAASTSPSSTGTGASPASGTAG